MFSELRRLPHVKRSLIGQWYDHAANMNSESAKGLLKWPNSALVCRPVRGKVCVLVISRGRLNINRQSLVLLGPPILRKNRGGGGVALIWDRALIQENTVCSKTGQACLISTCILLLYIFLKSHRWLLHGDR